jgi:hypothetical protein
MSRILETIGSLGLLIIFFLGQFPGGTIFMAARCDSYRLSGWDWVLSVIVPFFGLIKGVSC